MKTPTNIQFWVDKLKSGEKFSMARWGDGELYCMWGKKGQNSNGCRYYPELRQALLDAMKPREGFYHGLQCVLPRDEARIMQEYPEINWYETECLSIAVAEGKLFPLIEQLRKMDVMVVGNESIQKKTAELINWSEFCTVQPSNAFDERDSVLDAVRMCAESEKVVLFSCGMAANAFISELHGKVDATLIDVGHIWDPFTGLMSRCDLEGKTLSDIEKNLHP
jgi:hypothetical protein